MEAVHSMTANNRGGTYVNMMIGVYRTAVNEGRIQKWRGVYSMTADKRRSIYKYVHNMHTYIPTYLPLPPLHSATTSCFRVDF